MAGGVVEGPVQVDLVAGAGDAQRAGVVPTEGDEQGTLPGRTCGGEQRSACMKGKKKKKPSFVAITGGMEKDMNGESSQERQPVARSSKALNVRPP